MNHCIARATRAVLVAFLASSSTLALAATVYSLNATPGDNFTNAGGTSQGQAVGATGWYYNNTRNSGIVGINDTFARSGNGSVQMQTTQGPGIPSSKADIEYLANAVNVGGNWFAAGSLGSFASFSGMSYDWYRSSTSTNSAVQHPSLRVLVDLDGNVLTNDRIGLVFERAYNTPSTVSTDAWVSDAVGSTTNVWTFGALGFATDGYNKTLASWQTDGRLANAVVVGFSSGVGSGWGPFSGAVDNIAWAFGNTATSTNFEVQAQAVPLPGTLTLVMAGLLGLATLRRRR